MGIKRENYQLRRTVAFTFLRWHCTVCVNFVLKKQTNSFLEKYAELSGVTVVALLDLPIVFTFLGAHIHQFYALTDLSKYLSEDLNDREGGVFLYFPCTTYWSPTEQEFFRVYLNDYGVNLHKDRNK